MQGPRLAIRGIRPLSPLLPLCILFFCLLSDDSSLELVVGDLQFHIGGVEGLFVSSLLSCSCALETSSDAFDEFLIEVEVEFSLFVAWGRVRCGQDGKDLDLSYFISRNHEENLDSIVLPCDQSLPSQNRRFPSPVRSEDRERVGLARSGTHKSRWSCLLRSQCRYRLLQDCDWAVSIQDRAVKINGGHNLHQDSLWIVALNAYIIAKGKVQLASVTTIEEDDVFAAHLPKVIETACLVALICERAGMLEKETVNTSQDRRQTLIWVMTVR